MNLDKEYETALQNCESKLTKMSNERQYKGMEQVYHNELKKVLENSWQSVEVICEMPLEDIGGQAVDGRGHGFVDIVVEGRKSCFHGIELKVVQLPREAHLGPKQSLWDIGQITGDFLRLRGASKLASFDCVIVLHGALMSVCRTKPRLLREFHNRMFVDYKTSEAAGELKTERNVPFRRKQKQLIRQLGLDQPFTRSTGSMRVLASEKLGLIAISGPLT